MTRYAAGGDPSDYTIIAGDTVTVGALTGKAVVAVGGIEVKWWNDETGGTQYEDLLNAVGQPVTSVLSSDTTDGRALGQIPRVQYPDNVTGAWASAGGGPRVWMPADVGDQAVATAVDLAAHKAQANGHGTGLANLTDVSVPPPGSRTVGDVVGVVAGGNFGLLTPAQAAGAVLLNPPLSGGNYLGNVATPPLSSQGQNGLPWLRLQQPYSATDDNPDAVQFGATTSGGAWIKTNWANGNGEPRAAPSLANRIAHRVFEYAEGLGGPSTGRFAEWSTNPSNAANREPLLGGYGTGHPTKPGWVEATRVLSALLGVRAGGNYNSLSAVTFRGQKTGSGAPSSGTWSAGDVVIDAAGAVHLCTVAGSPGTWVSSAGGGGSNEAAPTAFVALTLGTNMSHGTKQAAVRLERGSDAIRLRGTLTAGAAVAAGAVLATIPVGYRPPTEQAAIARYSGGGSKFEINTSGQITYGSGFTTGQQLWLDGLTFDLAA